jgi:hypothetical protein
MNGVHDMGGMHGMGPIHYESSIGGVVNLREPRDPVSRKTNTWHMCAGIAFLIVYLTRIVNGTPSACSIRRRAA